MKIIITGATGFIGGAVLQRCLRLPAVTSIVVLSRRALTFKDPKMKVIIHEDFAEYPTAMLAEIAGADACIWCIGNPPPRLAQLSDEDAHRFECDYPLAAAAAFTPTNGSPFRFVYTSGLGAERDPSKSIWIIKRERLLKGEAEAALVALGEQKTNLSVIITRPAGVWGSSSLSRWISWFFGRDLAIQNDELAAVTVALALGGPEIETPSNKAIENAALAEHGQRLLSNEMSSTQH